MKCDIVYLQEFTTAGPQTRGFAFLLHPPRGYASQISRPGQPPNMWARFLYIAPAVHAHIWRTQHGCKARSPPAQGAARLTRGAARAAVGGRSRKKQRKTQKETKIGTVRPLKVPRR